MRDGLNQLVDAPFRRELLRTPRLRGAWSPTSHAIPHAAMAATIPRGAPTATSARMAVARRAAGADRPPQPRTHTWGARGGRCEACGLRRLLCGAASPHAWRGYACAACPGQRSPSSKRRERAYAPRAAGGAAERRRLGSAPAREARRRSDLRARACEVARWGVEIDTGRRQRCGAQQPGAVPRGGAPLAPGRPLRRPSEARAPCC